MEIDLGALPLDEGVAEIAAHAGGAWWQLAAGGGEDYELCVCIAPADRPASRDRHSLSSTGGARSPWIGRVAQAADRPTQATGGSVQAGVALLDADGRIQQLEGFEHRW